MSAASAARSLGIAALLAAAALPSAAEEPLRPPESHYLLHCSGCHGRDGRGVPGVTPSLHGLGGLARSAAGRAYLVGVPGVAQAPLDDRALARLLDWTLARFSGVRPGFEAEEVARHRRRPIRDTPAARAALAARAGAEREGASAGSQAAGAAARR